MQGHGTSDGGRLKGLHLQDLQKRVQDQAAWALAKVPIHWKPPIPLGRDVLLVHCEVLERQPTV